MSSLIGRALGVYHIEKKIGEGGNSDVYLARDTTKNKPVAPVALKVLRLEHQGDRQKVERFWNGGHSARALDHPYIVPVHDAGLADSRYFIAMEYMAGRSVENLLDEQRGALSWPIALHYLDQVAEAVDYAHRRGVVHRDIKPSNVLLSADRRTAYLTDFGIALLTGRQTPTESGTLVGTPEYISPEQIQGRTAGPRSDIYSLGVTAYQMLTGRLPFDGPAASVLYHHVHTPPPSIRRLNRNLPAGLAAPISRALAKEPERRYATAEAFARDLRRAAEKRRPGWLPWAGLAALALFLVLLAVAWPRIIDPGPIPTLIVTRNVTATPTIFSAVAPDAAATTAVVTTAGPTSTAEITPTAPPVTRPTEPPPDETTAPAETPDPPVAAGPRPLAPTDGADIPRNDAIQAFRWEWDGQPAENESYEIRFYPEGGGDYLHPFGTHKESNATVDLNNLPAGRYRWAVAVVGGGTDVAEGERRALAWGR
jgi:serine/threonine-protein kinase